MSVNLVAIAAFSAAGLSLVNVAVSARLSSRGSRDQWRREQAQPLVARILNLSTDAITEWARAAELKPLLMDPVRASRDEEQRKQLADDIRGHILKGQEYWSDMRQQAAQLELLASHPVRIAAWALIYEHYKARQRLLPDDPAASFTDRDIRVMSRRRDDLIDATRADFGIESARRTTWRRLTAPARGYHKAAVKMDGKTIQPAPAGENGEGPDESAPGEGTA